MKVDVERFATLVAAQAHARAAIDAAAEQARTRYVTPGAGQAMEYEAAHREAVRYTEGVPGAYPMLQADVDAGLAVDLAAAAQLVLTTRAQWEVIGSTVRRIRLEAKRQVNEATTQAEIAQVRTQAVAALGAM